MFDQINHLRNSSQENGSSQGNPQFPPTRITEMTEYLSQLLRLYDDQLISDVEFEKMRKTYLRSFE